MSNQFVIEPGKRICYREHHYRIVQILSLTHVELVDETTYELLNAEISELDNPVAEVKSRPDLYLINDKSWEIAKHRLSIIKPLLDGSERTREMVSEVAEKSSKSTNTLYNWIKAYGDSRSLSSLLPQSRKDKGSTKISQEAEEIIREVMATDYLTQQRKSPQKVCDEVARRCAESGVSPPHGNTVRNRIKALAVELHPKLTH